jgi:hypothetical protein
MAVTEAMGVAPVYDSLGERAARKGGHAK